MRRARPQRLDVVPRRPVFGVRTEDVVRQGASLHGSRLHALRSVAGRQGCVTVSTRRGEGEEGGWRVGSPTPLRGGRKEPWSPDGAFLPPLGSARQNAT